MPIRNLDEDPESRSGAAPAAAPAAAPGPAPEHGRALRTLMALSSAGARSALARLRLVFTQDPGEAADVEAEVAGARSLHRSALALRGGAAKVAQLMAYFEGPDALSASLSREELADLFDRVPGGDPEGVRRVVEEDLGRPPAQLFATFAEQPFAAASLGEVHDASDAQGQELAVKIQYPGVAQALAADLQSDVVVKRLTGGAMGSAVEKDAREVLRSAVLHEVDYRAEGAFMNRFRRAFVADKQMVVPRYLPDLSGDRVLTAQRLRGLRLQDFLVDSTPAERSTVAATMFRFAFGGPLIHGLLNADPNPGNYLVLRDEAGLRVGFLDFGCCVELPEATQRCDQVMWQALLAGDGECLRLALHREGLVREAVELDSNRYRAWEACLQEPFSQHRFTWSAAYARSLAELTSALVRGGRFTLPAAAILLWRQRLGVASVLGQLNATADFRKELLQILRAADMAPLGVS